MMKNLIVLLFLFVGILNSYGQYLKLSHMAQVSILTVDPGDELVDSFGHSAIRIKDPLLSVDLVYNYGVYDFEAPNFYGKFAQGKLLYLLGVSRFQRFMQTYQYQNRSVVEQILTLSQDEVQAYFEFLQNNAKLENRNYVYDFFYDNCATKLEVVSDSILKGKLQLNYTFKSEEGKTFRQLIHQNLDDQPWGKFGIDLALGSVIDKKAQPKEYLFLPEYVYKAFEKATKNGKPLVRLTRTLFKSKKQKERNSFLLNPLTVFSVISLILIVLTYRDYKNNIRTKWVDFILFFTTGLIGLLIVLLWFVTDHTATANNFNIFWALPLNLLMTFLLLRDKPNWIISYINICILLLVATSFLWILKVQVFSIAIIPLLLTLLIRYFFLRRFYTG